MILNPIDSRPKLENNNTCFIANVIWARRNHKQNLYVAVFLIENKTRSMSVLVPVSFMITLLLMLCDCPFHSAQLKLVNLHPGKNINRHWDRYSYIC